MLALFSFYYTNKTSLVIKDTDDIMIKIKEAKDSQTKKAIDAKIEGSYVIPGISGRVVDISKSYDVMKKVGIYSDNLLVFNKVKPKLSIDNIYNKYIKNVNALKVALIFKADSSEYIKHIISILSKNNSYASIFTNNDLTDLLELTNYGYNIGVITNETWAKTLVTKIANQKNAYCYLEEENIDTLNICSMNKMHTIIPSLVISKTPSLTVKKNLKKGMIISFEEDENVLKELDYIVKYIKSKGLDIVSLDKLLEE